MNGQPDAFGAFITWRPSPPESRQLPGRSIYASMLLTACICLVIAVLSFLAPLVSSGASPWAVGARLLLFCHLG